MPGVEIAIGDQTDDTVTDQRIQTSSKVIVPCCHDTLVVPDSLPLLHQALFVLGEGLLSNPAFSRDVAHAIDTLGLDDVILAFLGPAAGGAEFDVIRQECPTELKKRGLLDKLAFEWHSGEGFEQVCLHKVVIQVVQTLLRTSKEQAPRDLHAEWLKDEWQANTLVEQTAACEDVELGFTDQKEPTMVGALV